MSGIQYLVDDSGRRTAVVIDLATNGDLWEDFQDILVAREREREPRHALDDVLQELRDEGRLGAE